MGKNPQKITLRCTKDYSLFEHCSDNRPVNLEKHKKLGKSMQKYGFIPAYPMHVMRADNGKLVIRDGQHRFGWAQKLGLPVWYLSVRDMIAVLGRMGLDWHYSVRDFKPTGTSIVPFAGLVHIQWIGSWMRGPIGAQYARTHWIAAVNGMVYDCNADDWMPRNEWVHGLASTRRLQCSAG